MSRYYSRRLAQLETRLAQRQEIADAQGLKELAEIARTKILDAIARHRRGEPIPEPATRHESRHHEVLHQRLIETRERLMRFGGIGERMS
jgi:hypothetical protein